MSEHILVASAEGAEVRVGLLENGKLVEFFVERPRERGISGNIYKGKVNRVLPGMQAAFVDLGPTVERKAYLYVAEVLGAGDEERLYHGTDTAKGSRKGKKRANADRKIEDMLKENQEVLVQIIKEPVGDKGARVTGYLSLPGRHSVFMPGLNKVGVSHRVSSDKERQRLRKIVEGVRPQDAGFIIRTAAEGANEQEVADDVRFLLRLWEQISDKEKHTRAPALLYADLDLILRMVRDMLREDTKEILIDDEEQYARARKFCEAFMPSYVERIKLYHGRRPIFDHFGIEEALRSALHRNVPLKSGGSLVVEQGEALTAIDVNTGSFVGEADLETTITQNNIEACHAVADQLRLRNVGGIIVIDFVDMEKPQNRKLVWDEFQKALNSDSQRANVTKISELGLVEMTRKRSRESLKQLLAMPCPTCEGRGYIKLTTTIAHEILREVRRIGATIKTPFIEVVCAPPIADLLTRYERDFLDDLEKRFHKKVEIKKSGSLAPDQYRVAGTTVKDEEPSKKPPSRGGKKERSRNGRSRRRKDKETRETKAPPDSDSDEGGETSADA